MQDIVFLGIFDTIANWIMSGITSALTWLISNVIAPVCSVIWENAVKYVVEFIGEIIATFVYKLYAFALSVLYAIESAIYSFAGATNVNYQGKQDNIVSIIFQQPSVKAAFYYITALAVVLLFIFTIITVMKTTLDFGYDGRKNMGTIMTTFITSAITFLILPVFCYGLIDLTSRVMNALFVATSTSGTNSITDNLFLLSIKSSVGDASIAEPISEADYNGLLRKIQENKMFWYNLSDVIPYIHRASNVDFVIGIIGVLILIINLLSMAGTFIQRVIEIIVLYIVSPIFVATMPLDDGERFKKWRRTFIGRLCMGVGMIVALNVVMMVLCIVISGSDGYTISFTEEVSYTSDPIRAASNKSVDIILKIVFMVGCILSVKNLGSTITAIIDQEAGFVERHSMHENSERLKRLPGTVAGAVGAAKFAADYSSRLLNKMEANRQVKGSVSRGFQGAAANADEQRFADMIKRQNNINSGKSIFTKRGSKYSAMKSQAEIGNKALSDFRKLKTHDERKQFMENFKRAGGIDSLKVDSSKFVRSDMTNMKERNALANLNSRIARATENRNKFSKNSEGWKKFNNEVNSLSRVRDQFDMLNTHKEREAFIKSHGEFSDISNRNLAEIAVSNKLSTRADEAKKARDKMPLGSAEWKKADEKYQDLLNKKARFDAATTHQERSKFVNDNIEARADKYSQKERKALNTANDKKKRAIELRNLFKEGSAEWNKFNKQVEDIDKAIDNFNSTESQSERGQFINSNPIFKNAESMSRENMHNIGNINKNIKRTAAIRDKYKKGSDEWNKFNDQLKSLVIAGAAFEGMNTNGEKADFVSANADLFSDNTSDKENKAMDNLNSRKLTALNNRNMFKKGSNEWNIYNAKLQQLEEIGTNMQAISSKAEREEYIEQHSEFSKFNTPDLSDSSRAALNSNIERAIQNRNRHKADSAKWNQCNEEVRKLAVIRAEYDSMSSKEEKTAFAEGNKYAFTDSISGDKGYNRIEQSYNTWSALAQYSNDEQTREHAHKMAKAYGGFSEQYQRAETSDIRSSILADMDNFESHSYETSGIAFTPKEYSGIEKVMGTGNEQVISDYLNSNSHNYRSEILRGVAEGNYSRFEISTGNEEKFSSQLAETCNRFGEMARNTTDVTLKKQYEAMESFCREAESRYTALNTHSQREAFADYVTNEISQSEYRGNVNIPSMPPPDITERESAFVSKLNDEQRAEFTSLNSHRSRAQYMDNYYILSDNTLTFTDDEDTIFHNYFSGNPDTEYERTAQYRTAFLGAESHDTRRQIMMDYGNYVTNASESEKTGNWNYVNSEEFSIRYISAESEARTEPVEREAAAGTEIPVEGETSGSRREVLGDIVNKAKTRPRRNTLPPKKSNKDFFRERNSNNKPGGHE